MRRLWNIINIPAPYRVDCEESDVLHVEADAYGGKHRVLVHLSDGAAATYHESSVVFPALAASGPWSRHCPYCLGRVKLQGSRGMDDEALMSGRVPQPRQTVQFGARR